MDIEFPERDLIVEELDSITPHVKWARSGDAYVTVGGNVTLRVFPAKKEFLFVNKKGVWRIGIDGPCGHIEPVAGVHNTLCQEYTSLKEAVEELIGVLRWWHSSIFDILVRSVGG